ncbi:MAG TPA: methyltransferase domain-containing protein [Balneolaceae bacterium]|nr:methyltransferase domain-containing protein [Balneolaceae bacterium]
MNEIAVLDDKLKQKIASRFGEAAPYYDRNAVVQRKVAERMIASLEPWTGILPSGPIIELGCGTGFVTEGLLKLYKEEGREIQATDLSEKMVDFCQKKFRGYDQLSFRVQDAEDQPPVNEPFYSMAISGFSAQWFKDPAQTLARWLEATKPGGLLLVSFPGEDSFPEWRENCRELGLPFTGNTLPNVEEMVIKMSLGPAQVDYYEDTITQTFDDARDFFRQLKRVGASTQKKGRSLTPKEFSMLVDHWNSSSDGMVKSSYHVVFLAVKRDYDS